MTRTFKISGPPRPKQRGNSNRNKADKFPSRAEAQRKWQATHETFDPAKPHAKGRTPMDIKDTKAPRDYAQKRFYINVNHKATLNKEVELLNGREDLWMLVMWEKYYYGM